ncbi:hypothetical protein HYS94_03890 [Candidatus Daviesbacteria bacterium]|nr:hypothetical protein [Candidatus Daviesbacteria bacterium]
MDKTLVIGNFFDLTPLLKAVIKQVSKYRLVKITFHIVKDNFIYRLISAPVA